MISEQLKKHGETEELSARKLNIKELLCHLNHFNIYYGTGTLNGLRELIKAHPKVLETNLEELVHSTKAKSKHRQSKALVEKVMRLEYLETLHSMISKSNIERIDPFMYSYLLNRAKNHVIKKDPLMCLYTIKVLHRLKGYLNEFLEYNNVQECRGPVEEATKIFNPLKMDDISLFNPIYTQNCQLACFLSNNLQDIVPLYEVGKFREYTDTMMSLLFETWLEVILLEVNSNVGSEKNTETVISEDAASLLKHSLDIISLIWALVKHFNIKNPISNIQHALSQKYRLPYLQLFFKAFPYVTKNKKNSLTDPKLVALNLEICQVFILLNPNINVKNQSKDMMSVLNYIEETFIKNTQAEINDVIIKILHILFSYETNNWTNTLSVNDDLFNLILWAYFNEDMSSSFRHQIFNLLCVIGVNDKLVHFQESDAYQYWLNNLPAILLEETVALHTLGIINKFALRNNICFNMVARPKLLNIIENLPKLVKIPDVDIPRGSWAENRMISL